MGYVGWFQDYPDPSDFIDPLLSCQSAVQGGANASLYCNKAVDTESRGGLAQDKHGRPDGRLHPVRGHPEQDHGGGPVGAASPPGLVHARQLARGQQFNIHPVWLYDLRNVSVKPGS